MDFLVYVSQTVIMIVGIYQFYFWPQKNRLRPAREFKETRIDRMFGLKPAWVYIYSGLYYPVIALIIYTAQDMRHFNYMALSYVILMIMQLAFFIYFPVVTPLKWRKLPEQNRLSTKLLRLVQRIDQRSNCFPSMHVSVATLTSLHLLYGIPQLALWVWLFPLLIALSALYTKQHYFYDIFPGVVLGWFAFKIFLWMWE